jgi:uncharacterized protein (DUF58 family)
MDEAFRQALGEGEHYGSRYAMTVPETAHSGLTGQQLGKRPGSSLDFQDYRDYQPGDDLRSIDWSVYGRTDRLTVKLFREEVIPHVDILLDGSRSMNLAETPKGAAALQLAAMLATAAANSRCTRAVWIGGEGFRRVRNDSLSASAWDGFDFSAQRSLVDCFEILPPRLRRMGTRVLISDLFWSEDPAITLRRLSDGAAATHVIQFLAEADITPPEHGNIQLEDSETGESMEMFVDSVVGQRYLEAVRRHQSDWHDACRRYGGRFVTLVAERLPEHFARLEETGLIVPA